MKKLINKVIRRKDTAPVSRMTSETMAEHREHVLAGGRKFKYPLQYAKHKLVFNAIIISLVAVIFAIGIGWQQLYLQQNTSEFMYRVTTFIPLPVAYVDGQPVLYSDYLMSFRSSIFFSEKNQQLNVKTDDGKRQVAYFKQQSMHEAIVDAYAAKLSKGLGVSVSDSDLEASLTIQRQQVNGEVTMKAFEASTLDILGLSPSEFRHKISNGLLRQKVAFAMDKDAKTVADQVGASLKNSPQADLKAILASVTAIGNTKPVYGTSGWVPKANQDGGLALAAGSLNKLQSTAVIKPIKGDGYYVVRLLDSNSEQVNYEYIRIPLTAFNDALAASIKNGKVQEFISVPNAA